MYKISPTIPIVPYVANNCFTGFHYPHIRLNSINNLHLNSSHKIHRDNFVKHLWKSFVLMWLPMFTAMALPNIPFPKPSFGSSAINVLYKAFVGVLLSALADLFLETIEQMKKGSQ